MPAYFLFSDASGKYREERNDAFITKNPFFCRAAVLLEAGDWLGMREEFSALRKRYLKTEPFQKFKWSYVWSLYKHRQKGERIPAAKPYYPLRNRSLDRLVEFTRQALHLLTDFGSPRIVLTATFNHREKTVPIKEKTLNKMHLRHIMAMTEVELRKKPASICLFSFSPEEPSVERLLRESFFEILGEGMYQKYSHIRETLSFEPIHLSFGSQLADFCAGVFNGCLRLYPQSIDLFRHQIWPRLLEKEGRVLGYGIAEIPKNLENRTELQQLLEKIFETGKKDYRISAEQRLKQKKQS